MLDFVLIVGGFSVVSALIFDPTWEVERLTKAYCVLACIWECFSRELVRYDRVGFSCLSRRR